VRRPEPCTPVFAPVRYENASSIGREGRILGNRASGVKGSRNHSSTGGRKEPGLLAPGALAM
jgi:hypothetical protein